MIVLGKYPQSFLSWQRMSRRIVASKPCPGIGNRKVQCNAVIMIIVGSTQNGHLTVVVSVERDCKQILIKDL